MIELKTRFPWLPRTTLADIRAAGGAACEPTGRDLVKNSVRREPPPPPPAPEGVQALQQEIAANAARTAEIRVELARIDDEYTMAALLWDTAQDAAARERMNTAADARRALAHALADLADDAPRLQARLQAAKAEFRRQEHYADLERLDVLLAEFAPILAAYKVTALDLVDLATELQDRRTAIRQVWRRAFDYAEHTGLERPTKDLTRLTTIPQFREFWTSGERGARDLAVKELGYGDSD
jgi:hypothetical protein